MDSDLRVRRLPEKQVDDREALNAILDEALVAHVAVVRDGAPVVLPFACARDGDFLLLHGSTGAGLLRIAAREPVSVAVTHLDGLVFARSLFESSMHYRSAVVLATGRGAGRSRPRRRPSTDSRTTCCRAGPSEVRPQLPQGARRHPGPPGPAGPVQRQGQRRPRRGARRRGVPAGLGGHPARSSTAGEPSPPPTFRPTSPSPSVHGEMPQDVDVRARPRCRMTWHLGGRGRAAT